MNPMKVRIDLRNFRDIQQERIENENRIINFIRDYIKPRIEKKKDRYVLPDDLKYLNWDDNTLALIYDGKEGNYRKVADLIASYKIRTPIEIANLVWYYNRLSEEEKEMLNRIDAETRELEFRFLYLDNIIAVGQTTSAEIVANLVPLSKFSNPSKVFRFTGWGFDMLCKKCNKLYFDGENKLIWEKRVKKMNKDPKKYLCYCDEPDIVNVPQVKRAGRLLTFNPQVKTFFYVVASNFIKNKSRGSYYGKRYDIYKREGRRKYPDYPDWRIRKYAIRKTIREFLGHIWMAWFYIMEKKHPPASVYAIDVLKHDPKHLSYPVVDSVAPNIILKSPSDVKMLWELHGERMNKRK